MVDQERESAVEAIAASAAKISDSKGLAAIGTGLGWGIAALAFALALIGTNVAIKWDGRLFPEPKCFELQEVSGRIFRVNTCTGEATEIEAIDDESVEAESD